MKRAMTVLVLMACPSVQAIGIYYSANDTPIGRIFYAEPEMDMPQLIYEHAVPSDPTYPNMLTTIGQHLYWTVRQDGELWRSDLDGANAAMIVDGGTGPTRGLEYHEGKIYWANEGQRTIYRADPDGVNVEPVVVGDSPDYNFSDFAIYNDRIYWARGGGGKILRFYPDRWYGLR